MDLDDTIGRYNTRYTDHNNSGRRYDGTRHMDYDSEKRQNSTRHMDSDDSSRRNNNIRHIDFDHSIQRQNGVGYNERRDWSYARNNPTTLIRDSMTFRLITDNKITGGM